MTTTLDDCPHGEPGGITCPPCQNETRGVVPVHTVLGNWSREFAARFRAHCPACSDMISEGDQIRGSDRSNGTVEYRHAWCTDD